ncbi:MAG TPA: tRNA lysidine(34) synthetase TilS, partial [Dehalococcoidia bacterium]|nr:tRNA lysidine(34) synthetase TilS [Dehalococcoidia bacterium]
MTAITRFEESVAEAVGKAGLTGSNITVAISGGPDSTAMLLALNRTRAETGVSIKGAHLEHGIRGEESKSDAEHVKHLCKSINVECFFGAVDVPSLSKAMGLSLEDAARRARNRFFLEACADQNSEAVALGHTANDQSETILMHLIRGSGLDG